MSERWSERIFGPVGVLGLALVAAACCIGLPLLVAAIGGLALATVLGGGAGVLALVILLATIVWARRRRSGVANTPSPDAGR